MKVPIGYKINNGVLEIDKEKGSHIKTIFKKYLEYTEHPPQQYILRIQRKREDSGYTSNMYFFN